MDAGQTPLESAELGTSQASLRGSVILVLDSALCQASEKAVLCPGGKKGCERPRKVARGGRSRLCGVSSPEALGSDTAAGTR